MLSVDFKPGHLVEYKPHVKQYADYRKESNSVFLVISLSASLKGVKVSEYSGYITVITPCGQRRTLNKNFLQKVVDKT